MWLKRLFISITALAICVGASLSTGSGTAAAIGPTPQQILAAARATAGPVAGRYGHLGVSESRLESLFVSQTRLTPVRDTADLQSLQQQWLAFTPRRPAQGEVTARLPELPSEVWEAGKMLCNTAAGLLTSDDPDFWVRAVKTVRGQLGPGGNALALSEDLEDIASDFQSGCICKGVANLLVVISTETFC